MAHDAATRILTDSALGSQVTDWQPLVGGISASVHQLDYLDHVGLPASAVVRCHGDIDFARNAQLAADEYAVVSALYGAGFSLPEPLYLGSSDVPFGRPYAVYRYVEGELCGDPELLAERATQLAAKLAELHNLSPADLAPRLSAGNQAQPRQAFRSATRAPDPEIFETQIRALLERIPAPQPSGADVLLHGDFWWGNILWRNEVITAVLDWEDFGLGDALADLACARLELLWATDGAAVERFTLSYLKQRALLPEEVASAMAWWDLSAVLPFAHSLGDIAAGESLTQMQERLRGFVAAAFGVLGARLS